MNLQNLSACSAFQLHEFALTQSRDYEIIIDWSQEDLLRCGDRITNLQKLLNMRYGWNKADDFRYPKRFMEPVAEGPAAGKTPVGLDDAIMQYYQYRGWDENGEPTDAKLKDVGLDTILT